MKFPPRSHDMHQTPGPAPGEVPVSGSGRAWAVVAILAVFAVSGIVSWAPELDAVRTEARRLWGSMDDGRNQPVGVRPSPPAPPVAKAAAPQVATQAPAATAPFDDRARPVSFYFARWGVAEKQSPVGWTSRIEIRPGAKGEVIAHVWVTCPKGHCDAGEFPLTAVTHLEKKDMTAYLSMQRRDGERTWTFLLRPAPGRPDELERWEWYGPHGTETKTQSALGHIRRMRPDDTFH